MKLNRLFILLLFTALTAFKANNLPELFTAQLTRAQMTFTLPEGYTEVPLVKNSQMNYEFALKYPGKNFEVRYAIRPMDTLLLQFAASEKSKKPGDVNISPNKLYGALYQATVLNIAGTGVLPQISAFDKTAVKNEFNADWGATSVCVPGGAFGKGYKYCLAIAIHKDNIGDAYCFYLGDNQQDMQSLIEPIFHALKFK